MNKGKIIIDLRDKKGWNHSVLVNKSGVSRLMIGDAKPSFDAAKKS